MSWIHSEDLVGIMVAAWRTSAGPAAINATAPEPLSNRSFSRALGSALRRPSLLPVPGTALRVLYGEMAEIVTTGARVVPAKALVLGYGFRHPHLEEALSSRAPGARWERSCQAGSPAPTLTSRSRAGRFSVSMITRHGRLLSRYAAVGPIRCSPAGAWIADQ